MAPLPFNAGKNKTNSIRHLKKIENLTAPLVFKHLLSSAGTKELNYDFDSEQGRTRLEWKLNKHGGWKVFRAREHV